MVRILFMALCALLWRLGGWDKAKWSGYRDVLVPVLLGLWYAITLKWWMFLAVGVPANIIRLGYGSYDPENDDKPSFLAKITHDREGCWIRAIYGFITSFIIGLAPAIYTGHWWKFGFYVIGNTLLEFILNKMKARDIHAEPLNGAGRASVILCLR
jgi:hypothetical protein